jgi:serpin B
MPASATEVSNIVNTFGLALLKAVYSGSAEDGVFLSPLSLVNALGMVALGATNQGKAQHELLHALALNASNMSTFYSSLQRNTAKVGEISDNGIQLLNANSVWSKGTIKETYIHTVQRTLKATARPLPSDPAPINSWCRKATDGMIPSIIDSIDSSTAAILVNAVYFKGVWSQQFEQHLSERSFFTPASGSKRPCMMMKRTANMLYTEFEGVQIVELPYGKGSGVVATVLLPPRGEPSGLAGLVTKFGNAGGALTLESYLRQVRQTRVALQLPRFRMEFGVHDMKQELMSSFGVREAFAGDGAFLAMSNDRDVHVSSVLHKAVVEVNEEGTRAAAVTAGNMMATSIEIDVEPPIEVVVDRPFLFLIRSKDDGLLLFAGAVANPNFD